MPWCLDCLTEEIDVSASLNLSQAVDVVVASYKASVADGRLSFHEILTLVYNATATFVKLVESIDQRPGDTKKQVVLNAIDLFYATVVAPIDIQGIPNFLEGAMDAVIKAFILALASAWIDAIVNIFNKIGWGAETTPSGAAALQAPLIF
jgi:hypothetical protein